MPHIKQKPAVALQPIPQWNRHATNLGEEEAEGVLLALGEAVEQRDALTAGHCARLAFMAVALGTALGLGRDRLVTLYRGGYLHDVGKVGIPDAILLKPGKLDPQEWVTMRSHTTRGEDICRGVPRLGPVLPVIRSHHERWDGSGYPDGLKGEEIPLLARVLQIADIYDALTSTRPYKQAHTPDQAIGILLEETQKGWRDPAIVEVFLELHANLSLNVLGQRLAAD
jgi:putative two-component system response regulator